MFLARKDAMTNTPNTSSILLGRNACGVASRSQGGAAFATAKVMQDVAASAPLQNRIACYRPSLANSSAMRILTIKTLLL